MFDLEEHLYRQRTWSLVTFGPGGRLKGVLAHLRKELDEVDANPQDISEWIDLLILTFDGAMRQGFTPYELIEALEAKQEKNEGRQWPDWRTRSEDEPIEHVR